MESSDKQYETKKQILFIDSSTDNTIAHFRDAGDLDTPNAGDQIRLSAGNFDDEEEVVSGSSNIVDVKKSYYVNDVHQDYNHMTVEGSDESPTVYQIQIDFVSVEEQD